MNVEFVSLNCVHILYEYFEDFSICSAGSQQKLILHHIFVILSSSFASLVRRELKAVKKCAELGKAWLRVFGQRMQHNFRTWTEEGRMQHNVSMRGAGLTHPPICSQPGTECVNDILSMISLSIVGMYVPQCMNCL